MLSGELVQLSLQGMLLCEPAWQQTFVAESFRLPLHLAEFVPESPPCAKGTLG